MYFANQRAVQLVQYFGRILCSIKHGLSTPVSSTSTEEVQFSCMIYIELGWVEKEKWRASGQSFVFQSTGVHELNNTYDATQHSIGELSRMQRRGGIYSWALVEVWDRYLIYHKGKVSPRNQEQTWTSRRAEATRAPAKRASNDHHRLVNDVFIIEPQLLVERTPAE